MEIKSIQTKKIYKNIVEQIIYLIRDGSLKCGDRLPPERALAEMLDVSRASLREALSVMEIMGIVDIRPGEGSFVSDFNVQPFISLVLPLILKDEGVENELIEFRKILEVSGIKFVVENLKKDEPLLKELKKITIEMENSINDQELGTKLDTQFHKLLYTLTGNSILSTVMGYVEFILAKTVKYNRGKLLQNEDSAKELLKQHKSIYDAVVEGNAKKAAERMEMHLNYVNSVL